MLVLEEVFLGKATFGSDLPISVVAKPSSVEITLPENQTQTSAVGAPVKMNMQSDGQIRQIMWDFGDGNTYTCDFRACTDVTHIYTTP